MEFLGDTAATLAESCVAYLFVACENLSSSGIHRFLNGGIAGIGDTLITLTVIIGTYIEYRVVLTVIPADYLVVLLDKREEIVGTIFQFGSLLHLCQEP